MSRQGLAGISDTFLGGMEPQSPAPCLLHPTWSFQDISPHYVENRFSHCDHSHPQQHHMSTGKDQINSFINAGRRAQQLHLGGALPLWEDPTGPDAFSDKRTELERRRDGRWQQCWHGQWSMAAVICCHPLGWKTPFSFLTVTKNH